VGFNIDWRVREEIAGGGEEGAEGGGKSVADEIVGGNLVNATTLEDVVAIRVVSSSTWAEGFVSWFEDGEAEFAFEGWEEHPRR
jgi:hypothetical protein